MNTLTPLRRAGHDLWMRVHGYSLEEVWRRYLDFVQAQWMSPDVLREQQWRRVERLIAHAYEQVPYYRSLFLRLGLTPRQIQGPADFEKIPLLTKPVVQEQRRNLIARNYRSTRLIPAASGGSTGQPTRLYLDPARKAVEVADTWGYHDWMGWRVGDRAVRLWGSLDAPTVKRALYRRLARWSINELRVNVHQMDERAIDRFGRSMERVRPKIYIGYTNALFTVASHLVERRRPLSGALGVVTTAEMLFPHQRRVIEAAFGCRVFNRYASQEIGQLAGECRFGRLHVNMSSVYLEVLDSRGAARSEGPGAVVVTDLSNYAMPFIRYQLGDLGTPSANACECGRGLPVLAEVKGRLSDVIVTPDHRYIFADDIAELFYSVDGIDRFQVIQDREDALTVRIVATNGMPAALRTSIAARLRAATGANMSATIELVPDIPVLPSGKHRICISRVGISSQLTAHGS